MERRHGQSFGPRAVHRFLDRATRAPPADDQQVTAFAVARERWRDEHLLKYRELAASHRGRALMDARVVRDLAPLVVREPGDGVHALRLSGNEPPRQPRALIPIVRAQ